MSGRGPSTARSALALAAGTAMVVGGQAFYAARRRDLPTVDGGDASGREGDPQHPPRRVGAAGDSTLTGPGLAQPRDVWLRQALRELADARRVYFDLQSFAVGGARVRDVLRDQLEPLLDAAPDVAVIVVGTNDAIRGTPLPAVRRDLEAILRGALRRVPHVVVGGVGDLALIARVQWPLAGVLRVQGRAVNRVIWSVTAGFPNAHYIDVARADPDFRRGGRALFSDDLFHPNRDGHKLWADVARPVLDRAVR